MSVMIPSILGLSALTFLLALTGNEKGTWVMMIITLAGFVISNLMLHALAKTVDQA